MDNNTMTIHPCTWVRYSSLVAAGAFLLAACTVTEPLLYQGTTGGSPLPTPVYVYQRRGEVSSFNFISATRRITLTDYQTWVIDVVTQQDIHTFIHAPGGGSGSFSETDSTGKLFVQADRRTADVWDLTTGKQVQSFKSITGQSGYTYLSPDGKVLFFDNRLWDVTTAEQKIEFAYNSPINSVAFSEDGRYFARGGRSGIQWHDLQTKQEWFDPDTKQVKWLPNLLPDEAKTSQLQFGRDNRLYRSYGASNDSAPWVNASHWMSDIAVSQLGDNKTRKTFEPRSRIACWALSPNHQVFAALTNGTLVWLDEDLKIKKQWHSELKVTACLPDKQQRVWLGTYDSGLLTLYLEQGRLKQVLPPTYWIKSVKISADENYLGLLLMPHESRVEIYKTADLP